MKSVMNKELMETLAESISNNNELKEIYRVQKSDKDVHGRTFL